MGNALEIEDVSKRFGSRWAVARLSFSLPLGKSLLLTGHNGSGKTTLLRMIATATFPRRVRSRSSVRKRARTVKRSATRSR